MKTSRYRRTRLPSATRPRLGWRALCWTALIFSPFVGFTIHGRVDEAGLAVGLKFAALPLTSLALLAVAGRYAWRRLPSHIAEEWRSGRVVPAAGAPTVIAPARFSNKKELIEMRSEGLVVSRNTLLRMQGISDMMAKVWIVEHAGQMFVPWTDITEWIVETAMEGRDYYLLPLRGKGHLVVGRFRPVEASESELLDAVRSIGKLPVRLRCDIDDS